MIRAIALAAVYAVSCGGSTASRAQARGAVEATAAAVKVGDEACANYALSRKDVDLAKGCVAAYEAARDQLLVAAAGVDAWDEGKRGAVTCAVVRAGMHLTKAIDEMSARKLTVPKVVEDAVHLASALGACQ